MLRFQELDGRYQVYQDERFTGSVQLYDNPRHMKNCYVKLELEKLDISISAELFCKLGEIAGRPLQAMVSSLNTTMIEFLLAGGFQCKRKCYEVEATRADYVGGQSEIPMEHCFSGEADYEMACKLMYNHYVATHKAVNPWTADYNTFCEDMPTEVIYAKHDGKPVAIAFVDGNEIAYVCGMGKQIFADFAQCLTAFMLAKHEMICFECDDCDWAAMTLKSMFNNLKETSYNTYVYDNKG